MTVAAVCEVDNLATLHAAVISQHSVVSRLLCLRPIRHLGFIGHLTESELGPFFFDFLLLPVLCSICMFVSFLLRSV